MNINNLSLFELLKLSYEIGLEILSRHWILFCVGIILLIFIIFINDITKN